MKAVSELLGHASIQITGDIYTTLFDQANHEAAEAAADLVPRTNRPAGWDEIHLRPEAPNLPNPSPPEIHTQDLGL
jgi:hypothetical protein